MATTWAGKWAGGRVRLDVNGGKVWVIDCMREGARYSIALPTQGEAQGTTPRGLLIPPQEVAAELALFNRDPVAYKAACRSLPEFLTEARVSLRAATLEEFLEDRRTGDKPVCDEYRAALERYLSNWLLRLKGKDLRTVSLAEYRSCLSGLKPKRQHIVAIRSFTHWMRKEGRLSTTQDASQDLEVPQPRPLRAERAVGFSMDEVAEAYASIRSQPGRELLTPAMCQVVRDVIALKALTGMHLTEVSRLASGAWKVRRVKAGEIAGAVTVFHKRGEPHSMSLSAQALAAAERLQKRRSIPDKKTIHRILDACVKNERFNLAELRHSFATWADQFGREVRPPERSGASRDLIARVMGHKNKGTTAGHYIDTDVPPMIALPLVLENPEDPPLGAGAERDVERPDVRLRVVGVGIID